MPRDRFLISVETRNAVNETVSLDRTRFENRLKKVHKSGIIVD